MVVISYSSLRDFFKKHSDAEDALNNWYRIVEKADWSDFHEMKQMFNSVDSIGNDHYIFNIRGNTYRLIALIFFNTRTVYVRFVGTHSVYNKIKDCSVI
ncbi:type II toxin-antitoxin system HigB family toxin [Pedobacter nyackensis]|uniref:type II toxin-antitoxin system HigB family toxin n=1 Tax=Pedobacter nyackensis TaxID=475255 RepID=UPI00293110A9|nr:type II toxin-antitoxin system HigB family toxin [Pedobacter nyackensis]